MTSQKPFHHGNLKQVLLDAALDLLDQNGLQAVTIRAVARAAHVSHGAPVNHYKDRQTLLTAVAKTQFEVILTSINTALEKTADDPSERIEVFANAIMDYGFAYPNRYSLLWRADAVNHQDPALLEVMDNIYDQLCDEIALAVPKSNFDKHTVAVALWAMIHGYVDMRLKGMFVEIADEVTGKPRRAAMLDLFRNLIS